VCPSSTDAANRAEGTSNPDQPAADSTSINSLLSSSSHDNVLDNEGSQLPGADDGNPSPDLDTHEQQLDNSTTNTISTQVDTTSTSQCKSNDSSMNSNMEPTDLQPGQRIVYNYDSVQPAVLKSHLQSAYNAFIFLHHSFAHVLLSNGLTSLRNSLLDFFNNVSHFHVL